MTTWENKTLRSSESSIFIVPNTEMNPSIFTCSKCFLCGRQLQLDIKKMTCHASLVAETSKSCLASPPSLFSSSATTALLRKLRASLSSENDENDNEGNYNVDSDGSDDDDYLIERRRHMDQYRVLLNEKEKIFAKKQTAKKGKGINQCEAANNQLNTEEKFVRNETSRPQLPYSAIRASLDSAAGKYGPLVPSLLSQWRDNCYTQLSNKTSQFPNFAAAPLIGKKNTKQITSAQARIVSLMPNFFFWQYDWLDKSVSRAYMRGFWRAFHDSPTSPPAASSHLTVQCSEFRLQRMSTHKCTVPECAATPSSVVFHSTPIRADTPFLSLHEPFFSASSSALECICQQFSHATVNTNADFNELALPANDRVCTSPTTAISTTTSVDLFHKSRVFNLQKIRSMVSHSCKLRDKTQVASVSKKKTATKVGGHLHATPISVLRQEPTDSLSRETFFVNLLRNTMRCVVCAGNTNVPLCMRCWMETLEEMKKKTCHIINDAVTFLTLPDDFDKSNLVFCYQPHTTASDKLHEVCGGTKCSEPCITETNMENSDDKLSFSWTVEIDDKDVVRAERLKRQQVELHETETRSILVANACDDLCRRLELLAMQREKLYADREASLASFNAEQVILFYEVEDAVSGATFRTLTLQRGYEWLLKTHALRLAFPIDTSGPVATIAGLRLGKSPPPSSSSLKLQFSASKKRLASSMARVPFLLAEELNDSKESAAFINTLQIQHEYTRTFLGSRSDAVSVGEINTACGFLLLVLQHIIDRHKICVRSFVLLPNGDQSRVEVVTTRGVAQREVCRSADFFICDSFFKWKTFGEGCGMVAACVREVSDWLSDYLVDLRGAVRRRLEMEKNLQSEWSCAASALLQSLVTAAPPNVIWNDHVDGFSVRHCDVSEDLWTVGMKKLLEVLQWCVFASRDVDNLQRLLEEQ